MSTISPQISTLAIQYDAKISIDTFALYLHKMNKNQSVPLLLQFLLNEATSLELIHKEIGELVSKKEPSNLDNHLLSIIYYYGIGVVKDYNKSFKYSQNAALTNFTPAISMLGYCYLEGKGVSKNASIAFGLLQQAAKEEYVNAKIGLGICYQTGTGVTKNLKRSMELYQEASNAGNSIALYNLGLLYFHGNGVEKDIKKGLEFIQASANQNFPAAQYFLGNAYFEGVGLPKDLHRAMVINLEMMSRESINIHNMWMTQEKLGTIFSVLKVSYVNLHDAILDYQGKEIKNDAAAASTLGFCYQIGLGVSKDLHKAVSLHKRAVKFQYPLAIKHLWHCYKQMIGSEICIDEPIKYFRGLLESSTNNQPAKNIDILFILGEIYEFGFQRTIISINQVLYHYRAILSHLNLSHHSLEWVKVQDKIKKYSFLKDNSDKWNKALHPELLIFNSEFPKVVSDLISEYASGEIVPFKEPAKNCFTIAAQFFCKTVFKCC